MYKFLFALLMIFSVNIYAGYTPTRSSYSPSRSSFSSSRPSSSFSSYKPVRSSYTPRPSYTSSNGTSIKTTTRPIVTPPKSSYTPSVARPTVTPVRPVVPVVRPQVTSVRPSISVVNRPPVVERTVVHNNYIRSEPFSGNMSSFMAGAIVTHMIMDNGHRMNVYSNGMGGAYYVNNGMQVPLTAQSNGQFVEQPASVATPSPVIQTETPSNPEPRVRKKDDSWGFVQWMMVILAALFIFLAVAFVIHTRKHNQTEE